MSAERIDPESLRQEIVEAKVLKWPSYCVAIPRLERLLAVVEAALALIADCVEIEPPFRDDDPSETPDIWYEVGAPTINELRATLAPFRKEPANG